MSVSEEKSIGRTRETEVIVRIVSKKCVTIRKCITWMKAESIAQSATNILAEQIKNFCVKMDVSIKMIMESVVSVVM